MKKLICCMMIPVLCCLLCSCSTEVRFGLTKDDLTKNKRNAIEVVSTNDEDGNYKIEKIIYNQEEYFPCENMEIFIKSFDDSENEVLLSWNDTTVFRYYYTTFYFSNTEKDPLFIYSRQATGGNWSTFFKKDYNYMKDVFCVDGTDFEALFSDFCDPYIYSPNISRDATDIKEVMLISKTNPQIRFKNVLYKLDNQWYSKPEHSRPAVVGQSYNNVTKLSNEMVEKLKAYNIIE